MKLRQRRKLQRLEVGGKFGTAFKVEETTNQGMQEALGAEDEPGGPESTSTQKQALPTS